jgi:hypothetical protein
MVELPEAPSSVSDDEARPLCVIGRSSSIDQAEAALQHALLVTIGGNRPVVTPQQVLDEVPRAFNVNVSSMTIRTTAPEDSPVFAGLCNSRRSF